MATAFSYLRFSRPEQMKGDSQRRQLEHSRAWAKQNEVQLDESLNLHDLGISAFRGKNRQQGKLGLFLEAIKTGRVKPGDYLILENLDRLSREEVFDSALPLVQEIIRAGVNIVTLRTGRVYSRQTVREIGPLLEMLLELWLANEESAKKSGRLREAWGSKRRRAVDEKLTAIAPKWLRLSDDRQRFEIIPDRVKVVRRIFRLAGEGMGAIAIAKVMNGEAVPTFGDGKHKAKFWQISYIKKILASRAVLGEYLPHRMQDGKRVPAGEPVARYYPKIIDEAQFYAAQKGKKERTGRGGRHGKRVANLFTGLIKDARDGSSLVIIDKGNGPSLVSTAARAGAGQYVSFSYDAFERALIVWGYDLKLAEVLPRKATNIEDELATAEGRLADLNTRIATIERWLRTNDKLEVLLDTIKDLSRERDIARATVDRLKQVKATPEGDAANDLRKLLAQLGKANDGEVCSLRLKLRQLLRRLIEDIVVLVVQVNRDRVALADIKLRSGERRHVTIYGGKRVTLPDGLSGQNVRRWPSWPQRLRKTRFQIMDDETRRMVELENRGMQRGEIAELLEMSLSRVSRSLLRAGRRKKARKASDSERLMTWHPAGNGWVKRHRGQRFFIGLGKLAVAHPRLFKAGTADGSWKAANAWWQSKLSELTGIV